MNVGPFLLILGISFFVAWPLYVYIDWLWADNLKVIAALIVHVIVSFIAFRFYFDLRHGFFYTGVSLGGALLGIFVASEINRTIGEG